MAKRREVTDKVVKLLSKIAPDLAPHIETAYIEKKKEDGFNVEELVIKLKDTATVDHAVKLFGLMISGELSFRKIQRYTVELPGEKKREEKGS